MITPLQLLLVLAGIALGAISALFLKIGATSIDYREGYMQALWQMTLNPYIVGGLILYTIPTLLWIVLLKSMPLSLLQPLLALTYVVTPLMAMLFLYEPVSLGRWLGIGIIVLGVCVVARS